MIFLTGETGAGKSILLDVFSFVLGARLEKIFIQDDKVKSFVTFCIKDNQKVKRILDKLVILEAR